MSRFNLTKKLTPAKKAWKTFTKTLQSKTKNLKFPKLSIKTTTLLRLLSLCPNILRKPTLNTSTHHLRRRDIYPQNNSSAIYVDQLFPGTTSTTPVMYQNSNGKEKVTENSSRDKVKAKVKAREMETKKQNSGSEFGVDEAWKICSTNGLKFRGVDERAEEFISKFRQDMMIQREQSILDYQEMLARGL